MNLIFLINLIILTHQSCLNIEQQICAGSHPITLQNEPLYNVIGQWTFDQQIIQFDQSLHRNHLIDTPQLGPGIGANGNSAYFPGDRYSMIPFNKEYNQRTMTISFWFFPLGPTELFSTILRKALYNTDYTPTFLLWPVKLESGVGGGQIEVIVNAASGKESFKSRGLLAGRRWTHIILTISHNILFLYLNGVLDNQVTLTTLPVLNEGPFYIGGDPWNLCVLAYIDELTFWNSTLLQSEIIKISKLPGMINSRLFYLGCDACSYHQAITSCKAGWHLCSIFEIHAGLYQYARTQGWLRTSMDVWARLDEMDQQLVKNYLDPKISKAGICCYDSFY